MLQEQARFLHGTELQTADRGGGAVHELDRRGLHPDDMLDDAMLDEAVPR